MIRSVDSECQNRIKMSAGGEGEEELFQGFSAEETGAMAESQNLPKEAKRVVDATRR